MRQSLRLSRSSLSRAAKAATGRVILGRCKGPKAPVKESVEIRWNEKRSSPRPLRNLLVQWWKTRFRTKPRSKELMIKAPNRSEQKTLWLTWSVLTKPSNIACFPLPVNKNPRCPAGPLYGDRLSPALGPSGSAGLRSGRNPKATPIPEATTRDFRGDTSNDVKSFFTPQG
jgi:hypothetical protein